MEAKSQKRSTPSRAVLEMMPCDHQNWTAARFSVAASVQALPGRFAAAAGTAQLSAARFDS
jgi:hypothetical protein